MWKIPDEIEEDAETEAPQHKIKVIKTEDMEIFETDLGSEDESQEKSVRDEKQRGGDYGELERGRDIFDEEVSTDTAIKIFMDMEQKKTNRIFKPPPTDNVGQIASGQNEELPSVRIARLKSELEELQQEIIDLEKEEIPNQLKNDPMGSKNQLQTIDDLRTFMHKVVDSTHF